MIKINYAKICYSDKARRLEDVVVRMFYYLNNDDYFKSESFDYKGFNLSYDPNPCIYSFLKNIKEPSDECLKFCRKYMHIKNK